MQRREHLTREDITTVMPWRWRKSHLSSHRKSLWETTTQAKTRVDVTALCVETKDWNGIRSAIPATDTKERFKPRRLLVRMQKSFWLICHNIYMQGIEGSHRPCGRCSLSRKQSCMQWFFSPPLAKSRSTKKPDLVTGTVRQDKNTQRTDGMMEETQKMSRSSIQTETGTSDYTYMHIYVCTET